MQTIISIITDIFILQKLYPRRLGYVHTAMDQK